MTSGSWRRIARSALANVSFAFSLTCVWLTPGIWYSIGSSIVMMFVRLGLDRRDRGAQRRRLAAARRTDDEDHAVLVAEEVAQLLHRAAAEKPSSSSGGAPLR